MISLTNAVVHPWTMVIHFSYTSLTNLKDRQWVTNFIFVFFTYLSSKSKCKQTSGLEWGTYLLSAIGDSIFFLQSLIISKMRKSRTINCLRCTKQKLAGRKTLIMSIFYVSGGKKRFFSIFKKIFYLPHWKVANMFFFSF